MQVALQQTKNFQVFTAAFGLVSQSFPTANPPAGKVTVVEDTRAYESRATELMVLNPSDNCIGCGTYLIWNEFFCAQSMF